MSLAIVATVISITNKVSFYYYLYFKCTLVNSLFVNAIKSQIVKKKCKGYGHKMILHHDSWQMIINKRLCKYLLEK